MRSHIPDNDRILMLRGLLALAIIWHHLGGVPLRVFGIDIAFIFWMPGRVIVWLFFVISGYSIYWGYRNQKYKFELKDILRFYFNRAIRILPVFYMTVLLTWTYLLYLSPKDLPAWQSIVRTMFLLDFNFYQGIFAFTPAWFIGVIIQFYLIAPLLAMGYIAIRNKIGLIWIVCSTIFLSVLCHHLGKVLAGTPDIRNLIGSVSLFLFGFIAYDLYNEDYRFKGEINKVLRSRFTWIVLLCLYEWIFFLYHKRSVDFWSSSFLEGLVGLLGAVLIVVLLLRAPADMHDENIIVRGIKAFMDKAGKFSYGLYLWHGLVIMLVLRKLLFFKEPPYETASTFISAYLITVGISLFVSFVIHYIIEKPYQNLYKLE